MDQSPFTGVFFIAIICFLSYTRIESIAGDNIEHGDW